MKQASSLMVGAFSCYSMLTTLPYIYLNKINLIKVVRVILELFKLEKHSWNIEEHFIPYIYICMFIKVIWDNCNVFYVTF